MGKQHLVIRIEAPLVAFGGEIIDKRGVIRDFPAGSMMTGLIANALGYCRHEWQKLQNLQQRLLYALRWEREPQPMTDFQTVALRKGESGWTTHGFPEKRGGRGSSSKTYDSPHIRYRQYHSDVLMTVAFRLEPADETPTIEQIASSVEKPARPLYFGRKPCLPSSRICAGWQNGSTALEALKSVPPADGKKSSEYRAYWLEQDKQQPENTRKLEITDERDWKSEFHVGSRSIFTGSISLKNDSAT